jgi:Tfp pilus assembly protein PilN
MRPIRLEFPAATGNGVLRLAGSRSRRGSAIGLAALFLGAIAIVATAWQFWNDNMVLATARLELEAARAANGQGQAATKPAGPSMSAQQRARWTQLERQLDTPWSSLLDALEATLPDDVSLVSIEPDGAQGNVRVQAEAKSLDTLLAYASALRANDLFAGVTLIKHETNDQDATRPLRLSVDIRLKPSAPSRSSIEVAR